MVEADLVAVGVEKISLAPEPRAVGWWFGEFDAERGEAFVLGVNVAFEVEDDIRRAAEPVVLGFRTRQGCLVYFIHRQRRTAVAALKPSISRKRIDDAFESEQFKELDRFDRLVAVNGDLVEVHGEVVGSQ